MSEAANALSSETGLSSEMVHKGLGAVLDFLRQHLGEETFGRIRAAIPDAEEFLTRFESSADGAGGGGLLAALGDVARKFLGGEAGDMAQLLESFAKLGFKPDQIEAFIPRALAFIRSHLPADLVEQILAKVPALAPFAEAKAG